MLKKNDNCPLPTNDKKREKNVPLPAKKGKQIIAPPFFIKPESLRTFFLGAEKEKYAPLPTKNDFARPYLLKKIKR